VTVDPGSVAELLPRQRWFGDKGQTIEGIHILDEATLVEGDPALVFSIASVTLAGSVEHHYSLPLLVGGDGSLRDAFDDVERLRILGELMTHGETIKGSFGMFHFGGPGLDPRSPPGTSSIRRIRTEQSNSSLVLDDAVIVKLFRRVENGPNPDLELTRLLTNDGFEGIPAHVGEILYEGAVDGDEMEMDLGVAQQFVADAPEGWTYVLAQLRELLDSADDAPDIDAVVGERGARVLDELAHLGDVTAALHVLLAREELDPAVVAEAVDERDLKAWAQRARRLLQRLLDEGALELEPHREAIETRIEELVGLTDVGQKTRVHGDLHLGQVLLAPRGWLLLDFEGEPARPLMERRAKQSPLMDPAGMLRSFDYAAHAVLFERAEPDSEEWRRLSPWVEAWESEARARFLASYLRTSHEGWFLPGERSALGRMLDVFEIEKALYEVGYERGHRPEWVRIPLRGLTRILARSPRR
jgi:trehalose synthase-fused probable maltokinase